MRITHFVIAAAALLGIVSSPCFGDKLIIDPNAIKRPDAEQDQRLARKVTYAASGKRLHSVLSDISTLTGATIQCGDSEKDWRVNDLPVCLDARDLALGPLLQSIADALHLAFKSVKTENGWTHRIYRDAACKSVLEKYLNEKREAWLARASGEWDFWSALGDTSDADLRKKCDALADSGTARSRDYSDIRGFSSLVKMLGLDAKDRLMSGEQIILTPRDPSRDIAACVENLYHHMEDQRLEQAKIYWPNAVVPDNWSFTQSELDKIYVSLSFNTDEPTPSFHWSLAGPDGFSDLALPFEWSKQADENLPKQPDTPQTLHSKNYHRNDEEFEQLPALQVCLKLAKADPGRPLTLSSAISELSTDTGYTIVCEDFPTDRADSWGDHAGTEVTLAEALEYLSWCYDITWWLDEKQKLLVASSDTWCDHHANLVPESMLARALAQLDSAGVELDNALPFAWLSDGQKADWLADTSDISNLDWRMDPFEKPLWRLYDSLSTDDKALAKSDTGLSLAKLDAHYLSEVFRQCRSAQTPMDIANARENLLKAHAGLVQKLLAQLEGVYSPDEIRNRLQSGQISLRKSRRILT